MSGKSKPVYWRGNAARQAQRRFLRENKSENRVDDACKATAEVFVMCILSAMYDKYGVGEAGLRRVEDAAGDRAERYEQTKNGLPRLVDGKKKTAIELAVLELNRDTDKYFPLGWMLPIHKMPKKKNEAQAHEERMATAIAAKLYAYGLNTALGFGAEQVNCVMQEAENKYRKFRDWADKGVQSGAKNGQNFALPLQCCIDGSRYVDF